MMSAEHIDELVKKAAGFGGGKIHIIVNNGMEADRLSIASELFPLRPSLGSEA